MSAIQFQTPKELQILLGEQIKRLRVSQNRNQEFVAEKAGISEKSLRNLETGRGSTVETLIRTLKALNSLRGLELLAPEPEIDPIAIVAQMKKQAPRQRARRRKEPLVDWVGTLDDIPGLYKTILEAGEMMCDPRKS